MASSWYRANQSRLTGYLADDIASYKRKEVLAQDLPGQVRRIAKNAIKHAKGHGLSPEGLQGHLEKSLSESDKEMPLAEMVRSIYQGYQQALNVRNAVDYDDLIRHGPGASG